MTGIDLNLQAWMKDHRHPCYPRRVPGIVHHDDNHDTIAATAPAQPASEAQAPVSPVLSAVAVAAATEADLAHQTSCPACQETIVRQRCTVTACLQLVDLTGTFNAQRTDQGILKHNLSVHFKCVFTQDSSLISCTVTMT